MLLVENSYFEFYLGELHKTDQDVEISVKSKKTDDEIPGWVTKEELTKIYNYIGKLLEKKI